VAQSELKEKSNQNGRNSSFGKSEDDHRESEAAISEPKDNRQKSGSDQEESEPARFDLEESSEDSGPTEKVITISVSPGIGQNGRCQARVCHTLR
jgi:hypothetical protein